MPVSGAPNHCAQRLYLCPLLRLGLRVIFVWMALRSLGCGLLGSDSRPSSPRPPHGAPAAYTTPPARWRLVRLPTRPAGGSNDHTVVVVRGLRLNTHASFSVLSNVQSVARAGASSPVLAADSLLSEVGRFPIIPLVIRGSSIELSTGAGCCVHAGSWPECTEQPRGPLPQQGGAADRQCSD